MKTDKMYPKQLTQRGREQSCLDEEPTSWKNKHPLPSSAARMQPLTTQWPSVVPLKHPAGGEPESSCGGGDFRPPSLLHSQSAHMAAYATIIALHPPCTSVRDTKLTTVVWSWCLLPGSLITTSVGRKISLASLSMTILELWTQLCFCC